MTAISRGCRIGKIRLKSNGAEIRLLPSARQAHTDKVFEKLRTAHGWIKELYADDLDGFVLVAWKGDGGFNTFVTNGKGQHSNTLPEFVAEAVRRDNGDRDMELILDRRYE